MFADVWTIASKELREALAANGGRRGGLVVVLLILVVSVILPLSIGASWLTSAAVPIVYGLYIPMAMVMSVIADAFAGERERHTLETLLATRLSDRAILFGKLGACVLYGLGVTLAGWLVAAIATDITHPNPTHFYPPISVIATLVIGVLTSLLMADIGMLVSLRASSVRQAQQLTSVFFLLLYFLPFIAFFVLPNNLRDALIQWLITADPKQVVVVVALVLVVIDALLLGFAILRFQRARLIVG